MKISTRLDMSANLFSKHNIIADVGCDHGYSSIYLVQHNKCRSAIAMDLRKGPLSRAI